MSSWAQVAIHPSQFPDRVRDDLFQSLRARRVNHKFHYDSVKQTQKWLALHQAYSPSRTDPDCQEIYQRAFLAAAQSTPSRRVHLVGLGCGGGQKDTRLLQALCASGKEVSYTPLDVSTAMVLVARQTVFRAVPNLACSPLVCDLGSAPDFARDLDEVLPLEAARASRFFTFFGMIPNFEPQQILPLLSSLIRPGDLLLFSANLAPGPDYAAGVRRILPLYDNPLTRDWLITFLFDLGVEPADGELRFEPEEFPQGSGLLRVAATFHFLRQRVLTIDTEHFNFNPGEAIGLFYSYRHTPTLVRTLLKPHGLSVQDQWITRSEEEGAFLIRRL
jgi:uncharacterized SAM-dependent methyltransferase